MVDYFYCSYLLDPHSISKTIKPIVLINRMLVDAMHLIKSHKCSNEHEETTFGKVKVGDKLINDAILIAGVDVEFGSAV